MLHKAVGFMQDPDFLASRVYRTRDVGQQQKNKLQSLLCANVSQVSQLLGHPRLQSCIFFVYQSWSETDRNLT